MRILRIVPRTLKTKMYGILLSWCKRNKRRIDLYVYRLPFGLVLKSSEANEAAALRFVESLGVDSARWIDDAPQDKYSHFTLMTYIPGDCCRLVWPDFTESDKEMFLIQLREIVHHMRKLTSSSDHAICNVEGNVIDDPRIRWVARENSVVFTSSPEFFSRVWIQLTYKKPTIGGGPPMGPFLRPIIDRTDRPIVFTHGDILPKNMMLPGGLDEWRRGRSKLCLIDWQNACFAPLPWEALKATWLCGYDDAEWFPMMKEVFPESLEELEADRIWRSRTHVMLI